MGANDGRTRQALKKIANIIAKRKDRVSREEFFDLAEESQPGTQGFSSVLTSFL